VNIWFIVLRMCYNAYVLLAGYVIFQFFFPFIYVFPHVTIMMMMIMIIIIQECLLRFVKLK
jgi:hypothetical protein